MFSVSRKESSSIVAELIFIITGSIFCTPILSSKPIFMLISIALYMIYIVQHWSIICKKNDTVVECTIMFLLIVFVYRFVGISNAGWSRYFLKLGFFLPVFIMLTIPSEFSKKSLRRIWWSFVLVSTLNISYNIYLGIIYPSINTQEVQAMLEESVLDNLNLGRSPFFTYSLFFFSVCFFVFLNCKLKIEKYFMLICSLITAVYICWFCFKASVVVLFLVTVVLLYFGKGRRRINRFIIIMGIVCGCIFLLLSLFSNEIIQMLISISPDERLTGRLITLIDSDNSEAYDATLQGREKLAILSVETWLSSPINFLFGIGDHYVAGLGAASTGIGQHAELIDGLAQYGIIGMGFFFNLFKKSMDYVALKFKQEFRLQIILIFGVFLLSGLAKYIILPGIGFVLFILLPLSANYINLNEK